MEAAWWCLTTCLLFVVVVQTTPINTTLQDEIDERQGWDLDLLSDPNREDIWCSPCPCGVPNRKDRIVGGWPTRVNEYPWVVALAIRGQFYCGGTIINDLYILTAAHCVNEKTTKNLKVVVSEHNKATMEETMVEMHSVAKVIVHKDFNKEGKYNNDIALLKLEKRLKLRQDVAPICLPYPVDQFHEAVGLVTGWGHTKEGGPPSMELRETRVAVMTNAECHSKPGYGPNKVTENMMCAGLMEGGRDTCQGDSGGSLIIEDWQGRMFQAGIVSWGIGCARPNRPGVYTRVNKYLDWITKNTNDACYCI